MISLLRFLEPIRAVFPDAHTVHRAIAAHTAYHVHFYDGMIIAAAEKAGCGRIFSEDMSTGQHYFGISVVNPFKEMTR